MTENNVINRLKQAKLYGILDLGYVDKEDIFEVASALIEGGVGVIQLRAKAFNQEEILRLLSDYAPGLGDFCRSHGVPFIINDFPEVALAVGADGIHLGQDDGLLADVRAIMGESMIVGRSTHSPEQAKAALQEGVDYIGFGPLFPTPTKQGRPGIGLENIMEIEHKVGSALPVFCIGGIKFDNLELVLASGARRVVIVSALLQAANIRSATQRVLNILNTAN